MNVTVPLRPLAVGAAAAVVIVGAYALGNAGRSASAAPPSSPAADTTPAANSASNGISVSGVGRVTGTPNLLRLQTSVNVVRPSVNDALQEANTTMANVQAKLKADGVAAKDLQTSGLSVQPHYNYNGGTSKLDGYEVSENLSVVLRDLPKAGSVISDAAQVGGDELQLGGATLDLDEDDALIAQARQKAFADAKAKAAAYADAAGRSLGAVMSISESTDTQPQPYKYLTPMAAASGAAAPVPVEAGSQDVTVTVSVVWAMS
ncbi:MAG TPA: SIMPL domain-containing protein [Acidothermaceae bacterium]|jgi:uncharacterized protein YggE|nr:SIMPL domain-containing protein [Acidothermaceae bacterium]